MRIGLAVSLAFLGASQLASAQTFPADPVKHIDGYWYATDQKVEVEIKDGVATIKVNESEDLFIKKLSMPPGTVIAQLAGFTAAGKRDARLHGQCWQMFDTTRAGLQDCGDYNAGFQMSNYNNKPTDLVRIASMNFVRKDGMPEYQWKYRK